MKLDVERRRRSVEGGEMNERALRDKGALIAISPNIKTLTVIVESRLFMYNRAWGSRDPLLSQILTALRSPCVLHFQVHPGWFQVIGEKSWPPCSAKVL